MGLYPYNPMLGQRIQTHVKGVSADTAFPAHLIIAAEAAVAASANGVKAATILAAIAAAITAGITSPAVPRALSITGNVSGIAGNVVITGTNYADEVITETIALSGMSTVDGLKAFKTITGIALPARTHTPAYQTETKEVTHAVTAPGTVTLELTAAALGEASPKVVEVEIAAEDDTVTKVAEKMVDALNADEDIGALFTASNEAGVITLTAKAYAANDATLALAFTDTDTTGVTMGASTNGTAGVPDDTVSIGWNDKLGLPYLLTHNTVFFAFLGDAKEGTPPTVVTDADEIEKNTIDLTSALNGTVVDIYLFV